MDERTKGPPLNDEAHTRNRIEAILQVLDYLVRTLPAELRAQVKDDQDDSQTDSPDGDAHEEGKAELRLLPFKDESLLLPTGTEILTKLIRQFRSRSKVHA